ncbi:MAG: PilZ domain-containing protein [Vicinamibacteria bacterium]
MPRIREKRKASRIQPFVIPCRVVHRSRHVPGHLVDLSVRGARIASEEELPKAGSLMTVEARFGAAVAPTRLPCQVKWVRKAGSPLTGHLAGITFRGLTDRQQLAVEFVLYEFRRRAAALN